MSRSNGLASSGSNAAPDIASVRPGGVLQHLLDYWNLLVAINQSPMRAMLPPESLAEFDLTMEKLRATINRLSADQGEDFSVPELQSLINACDFFRDSKDSRRKEDFPVLLKADLAKIRGKLVHWRIDIDPAFQDRLGHAHVSNVERTRRQTKRS